MLLMLTLASATVGAGCYLLFKRREKTEKLPVQSIHVPPAEVIFFTGANTACRRGCICVKGEKKPCGNDCSILKLKRITDFINNAESTIDVCVYLITCNELACCIIQAYRRGVKIRIIIDEGMSTCTESKCKLFMSEGIPLKSKESHALMHHKFCVIDFALPKRKLLTGSLNWTLQGLAGNYEYVTITSHPEPVLEFQKEFNTLWEEFCLKR